MSYHNNNRSQPRTQSYQPPAQRSAPAPSPHVARVQDNVEQGVPEARVPSAPTPTPISGGFVQSCCTAIYDALLTVTGLLDDKNRLTGFQYFLSTNNCSICEWERTPDGKCPNEGMFSTMSVDSDPDSCFFSANLVLTDDLGECECAAYGFQVPGDPAPRPLGDPYGTEGQPDPDHPPEGIIACGEAGTTQRTVLFDQPREGGCMTPEDFLEFAQFILDNAKYELVECCTGQPVYKRPERDLIPLSKRQVSDSFKEALANDGNSKIRDIETNAVKSTSLQTKFNTRFNQFKNEGIALPPGTVTTRTVVDETGPFALKGYYPLYDTIEGAVNASPNPRLVREGETTRGYHTHTINNVIYYMPNGLEMGVSQFHGDLEDTLIDSLINQENKEKYRGEWRKIAPGTAKFTQYEAGDIVTKNGVAYIAMMHVGGNVDPEVNSYITYEPLRKWTLYAGRPTKIDGGFF